MRLHLVVRGRVQGVGFRYFVREAARDLGLAGWVSNRPDGGVEVAAEGDEASMRSLCEALTRGPSGAAVSSVDDLDALGGVLERPFSVRR
jgi:acylphosphatase